MKPSKRATTRKAGRKADNRGLKVGSPARREYIGRFMRRTLRGKSS